ncbi:MAG: hypothetical protein JXM69_15530 [Anaerolineae bacterium]|nr:hypothetical protein [Anaerolineae bacterium]
MKIEQLRSSWSAFALFYVLLVIIVTVLDWVNSILTLSYWGTQVGLITLGVGVFAIFGIRTPDLSATRGVLLAFTVGILTIIPAVLMGLGRIPGMWPQYFYIALGMATGSFLSFLFIKLARKIPEKKEQPEEDSSVVEGRHVD